MFSLAQKIALFCILGLEGHQGNENKKKSPRRSHDSTLSPDTQAEMDSNAKWMAVFARLLL
jgi:hypothetical protein